MRTLIFWRLTSLLLIVSGPLVAPELNERAFSVVAQEDDADDDGDDNRGHGNDSNRQDEDNPGRGNNKDDKPGKDKDDKPGKDKVAPTKDYAVEATCEFDADANSTECAFTGIAPSGAMNVSHIVLPKDEVCGDVTGGTHEFADPDPNTQDAAYTSISGAVSFTLILTGEVATSGAATYWLATDDGVFPSTGPGLICDDVMAGMDTEQAVEATVDVTDSTGALLISTYQCMEAPENTDEFDWFGACNPIGGMHEFILAGIEADSGDQRSEESSGSGSAAFEALAPGTYRLQIVDTQWCHAVSDNVTDEGYVIIEAGERTTVWGFVCDDGTVK